MRRIFIDTAHLLAILNPRDNLHRAALAAMADLANETDVQFVTTHLVLSELLAALSVGGPYVRIRAADFVADFLNQAKSRCSNSVENCSREGCNFTDHGPTSRTVLPIASR